MEIWVLFPLFILSYLDVTNYKATQRAHKMKGHNGNVDLVPYTSIL